MKPECVSCGSNINLKKLDFVKVFGFAESACKQ